MGHYDGKEFEKILQEAQANMMKGIPSLEVEENPAVPPVATGEQSDIKNNPVEPQPGTNPTTQSKKIHCLVCRLYINPCFPHPNRRGS